MTYFRCICYSPSMQTERTTLNLPTSLIEKVKKLARVKTKTEAIVFALEEILRREKLVYWTNRLAGSGIALTQKQLKKMRRSRS